jgi:hypothetical protein
MNADEAAIEEARRAGFDLSLIESNLALTPEERALRHESALELVLALREAAASHEKSTPAVAAVR